MRSRLVKITIILSSLIYLSALPSIAAQAIPEDPLAQIFAQFHADTNQLVNQKIKGFTDLNKSVKDPSNLPKDFNQKLTTPTALDTVSCEDNLSASCLQFLINQNFTDLTGAIQQNLSSLQLNDSSSLTTTEITQSQGQKIIFIQSELEAINDSVEQTLIFYQQLLLSLPLHNSYQLSIQELDNYIEGFQDLEFYIQKYPSKYNNVTTPYCQ